MFLFRKRLAINNSLLFLLAAPLGFATTYNCTIMSVAGGPATANGITNTGIIVGGYPVNNTTEGFVTNPSAGNFTTVIYPGSISTTLHSINNNGIAVGEYVSPDSAHGFFIYDITAGTFSPITVPAPYSILRAWGINDNGQISTVVTNGGPTPSFAILNPDGSLTLLPGFNGQGPDVPAGINNAPKMIENASFFGGYALVSADGTSTPLSAYSFGVNNSDFVIGYHLLGANREPPYEAVLRDPSGSYTDVLCPGVPLTGTAWGYPIFFGINDNGVLAGTYIATPQPGEAQMSLSTTSVTFPATPVGQTTAPQTITITNTGNARLDIATLVNSCNTSSCITGPFSTSNDTNNPFKATGCLDPATLTASLDPGASCTITVTATPKQQGQSNPSYALILYDSAPGSPHKITLSVTGTVPPPSCTVLSSSLSSVSFTAQDTTYGLSRIVLLDSTNATVNIPSFISGTTGPVVSTASQINTSQSSKVDLQVTNTQGGSTTCGTTFGAGGGISNWTDLGGSINGKIVVANNADGRLQAFARGTDNALWTVAQTSPDGAWGSWQNLGGYIIGDPAVGVNADGRLEAFALGGDSSLWHIWQTSAGGAFSGWAGLGNTLTSDAAVTTNSDGRMQVFAAGPDSALWTISQTSAGGGWSGWTSLGGRMIDNPTVVTNTDGSVEAFVLGTDASLWHIYQTSPGGDFSGWAGLGGSFSGDPVAVMGLNGLVQIVATGSDHALYAIAHPSGEGWSAWSYLGGYLTSSPAAVFNADGRLEAFARGGDNALWHIVQTSTGGSWGSWTTLGGSMQDKLAAARNSDGIVDAFSETNSSTLQYIGQASPGIWQ